MPRGHTVLPQFLPLSAEVPEFQPLFRLPDHLSFVLTVEFLDSVIFFNICFQILVIVIVDHVITFSVVWCVLEYVFILRYRSVYVKRYL